MNKNYLRQLFQHANSGFGYQYIGEIPNNVDIPTFVTSRYVELSKNYGDSTIVSWSNQFSCAILYVPSETSNDNILSEFELIDDLVPVLEPEIVEEPSITTDPEIVSE